MDVMLVLAIIQLSSLNVMIAKRIKDFSILFMINQNAYSVLMDMSLMKIATFLIAKSALTIAPNA